MLFEHFRGTINFSCITLQFPGRKRYTNSQLANFLCLNVVEVFGDSELLVEVGDGDGGELAPDPRVNGEDVVRPPVGAVDRRPNLILHLVEHLGVVVLVLLYLRLEGGLLGLQVV